MWLEHIKARFLAESSGHDWYHIHRVWKIARQISLQEGANQEVVELSALVHDIADWKFHGGDESIGPREAERLLNFRLIEAVGIGLLVSVVPSIINFPRCAP